MYKYFRDDGIVEFEKRMDIVLVDQVERWFIQEKIANLKNDKFVATCRPKLILSLEGKILHEINGANIPELDENVRKFVPYIWNFKNKAIWIRLAGLGWEQEEVGLRELMG